MRARAWERGRPARRNLPLGLDARETRAPRLINNTFAAEYGRTGGGIESFVTASGGNRFHGNVFDFHNSSALSARTGARLGQIVAKINF